MSYSARDFVPSILFFCIVLDGSDLYDTHPLLVVMCCLEATHGAARSANPVLVPLARRPLPRRADLKRELRRESIDDIIEILFSQSRVSAISQQFRASVKKIASVSTRA